MTEETIKQDTKRFCECGCGQEIPLISKHRREVRRFSNGHNRRGKMHPNSIRWREHNNRWKGGSYVTIGGYIMILKPDHPEADCHGYVYEHRFVMEQKIGRLLKSEEHIHHINRDRKDNRPENLQIVSNSEHRYLHCRSLNGSD